MRRNLLGVLQRATVPKVGGDSGSAKGMTAGGVGQGGSLRPPLDHVKHVTAYHRIAGELVALFEGTNFGCTSGTTRLKHWGCAALQTF
jgi:hypothetical protein